MPTQNLSAFTPEIWSKRIITRYDQVNVMGNLVNTTYEGEIRQAGDTVWVRTFGNVVMSPYKRSQSIDYTALSPSKENLKVTDSQYFAIQVDDLDSVQNDLDALNGYADRAAVAMKNLVEAKQLGYYALAGNKVTGASNSAITITSANAYATIVKAGLALDKKDAPQDGRWLVVDPDFKSALVQDTANFIRATDMGDSIVRTGRLGPASKTPGFIGQVSNFDIYVSNYLPTDNVGRYCQFGAGKVISYAGQLMKLQHLILESSFAEAIRGLILHDATVFTEQQKAFGYILRNTV